MQKKYKKAKQIIPGGSQLLSKRPEMYLPNYWPPYFQKARGVIVWDIDKNLYIDMSNMSVGACILGYADNDVNKAVKKAVDAGSISSLNCYEEVELAELLIDLNPWSDMVRYAKTGGEAMAVAVRIARAHTGKDKVAFCGYHGWSDWYLSANLSDETNLDKHLLAGLKPDGVPKGLINTSFPFNYNNIEELKTIVDEHDIGTIVMEPVRHQAPKDNFLQQVRKIANNINAVLIFDEITSGWRLNVGGAHNTFKVYPDIAVYGKAMSNGYPMAAIVGSRYVMDSTQKSFISSTYWTDRIGIVASLATINKLEKYNVPSYLNALSIKIKQDWKQIAEDNEIKIKIVESVLPLPSFTFEYHNNQAIKTLFTQEMLKEKYLTSDSIYVSYSHTNDIIDEYMFTVNKVFKLIKKAIDSNMVEKLLDGPIAQTGFQRLT